jgi:hypothetical protein
MTWEFDGFQERLAIFRSLGDAWGMGASMLELAHRAWTKSDLEQSAQWYQQSLEILHECGDYAHAFWPCLYLTGFFRFKTSLLKRSISPTMLCHSREVQQPWRKSHVLLK